MRSARWLMLTLLVFGLAGCRQTPTEDVQPKEDGKDSFRRIYAEYNYAFKQEKEYTEYAYDESGELIEANTYSEFGELEQKIVYSYELGNKKAIYWSYDKDGNASASLTIYYNDNGDEVRRITALSESESLFDDGKYIGHRFYIKKDDGSYVLSSCGESLYDNQGNWIEDKYYEVDAYGNAQLTSRIVNAYNSEGEVVSQKTYYGNELYSHYVYEYDFLGQLTAKRRKDFEGKPEYSYCDYEYEYDENGRCILERLYHIENGEQVPFQYKEFEYDEFGNLIRESSYYGYEGNSRLYSEFKYTYERVE